MTTRTGRRHPTGSPSRRNGPLIAFIDRRVLGKPRAKPIVIARHQVVRERRRDLVLHGEVHLRYEPRGIEIYDSPTSRTGFLVEAFIEWWPE